MTERERLIELMTQAENKELNLFEFEKKILADYLLANGVAVLPCKVGDTVYYISEGFVESCKVQNISTNICFGEIGKTVFLTKEEAEQALKERQTNENT